MKHISLDYDALSLSKEDILLEMGYHNLKPDGRIISLVDTALAQIRKKVRPEFCVELFEGNIYESTLCLSGKECFHVGPVLAEILDGADRFIVFVATAGKDFHSCQEATKAKGDVLNTYIVDTIGTCIVEKTGDYMEAYLGQDPVLEKMTKRLSPGYCGWELPEQRKIFKLFGGRPCGVSLSDSCLMVPVKSITGVIGIGSGVKKKPYGCHICTMENCYKRKRKKE